ncbi:MAG: methyltransferase, partial [Planctomycetes bacterium]|nr:methyltransferase [Planctomycetota bacterium]
QLAIVDEDVLQRFRVDTIELGRGFALGDEHWTEWTLPDGTKCLMPVWARPERDGEDQVLRSPSGRVIARMPPGVSYFEQAHYPFADVDADDLDHLEEQLAETLWAGIASPPGPLAAGPDGPAVLREGARALRASTDRAILALFGGNLLEAGQCLYRNDGFLLLLAAEPQRAHRFLDRLVELHQARLETFLGAVGPFVDVVVFGDDFGMQQGPQISPRMYREFFQPRQRRLWDRVRELAPVRILLHCCGGVRPLLPGLIEAGLDAINPVQIRCAGMDPVGLKRDFGDRLTFWGGGCDTRDVLAHGSPAQVREHVRRLLDVWRPGGGYVFQQVHNVLADVPTANVVAMLDAAGEG